jgi:hypothetical protein
LAQVCQRWRSIIFASPSRLGLHLLCTYGTPVADMLTHSPPLPLTIFYFWGKHHRTTEEDGKGILLALQHSDRVRDIVLSFQASSRGSWEKIITAMNKQFPILQRVHIRASTKRYIPFTLPSTFQAPLLRHFTVRWIALPIGLPMFMTTVGLVTLTLDDIPSDAYFPPSDLLTRLSLMPHLEELVVHFSYSSFDVEPQLSSASAITHITLPNLRVLCFGGVSSCLDALLASIAAPLLNKLNIVLSNHSPFAVPHLLQFMRTTQNWT